MGITRLDAKNQVAVEVGNSIPAQKYTVPNSGATKPVINGIIDRAGLLYLLVSAPILSRDGERVGTDIILFHIEELKALANDFSGLGTTGEPILGLVSGGNASLILPMLFRASEKSLELAYQI